MVMSIHTVLDNVGPNVKSKNSMYINVVTVLVLTSALTLSTKSLICINVVIVYILLKFKINNHPWEHQHVKMILGFRLKGLGWW